MRLFSSNESRRRSLNDCILKLWHFHFSLLNNCSTLIILHFETMNSRATNGIRHLCRSTVSLCYDIGTIINKLSIEMFAFQRTLKPVSISGDEGLLSNLNISTEQNLMEESHCWQIHQLLRPNARFQSQYVKQSHFVHWVMFFSEIFICSITHWDKWNGSVAEFREDFLRHIGMWSKHHHYIVVQWKESLIG